MVSQSVENFINAHGNRNPAQFFKMVMPSIRGAIVNTALGENNLDIVDVPKNTPANDREEKYKKDLERIRTYIHGPSGLVWAKCPATGKIYNVNGDFEWCGAFAAYCYGMAGAIKPIRHFDFASTYRLAEGFAYNTKSVKTKITIPGELAATNLFKQFGIKEGIYTVKDFHTKTGSMRRTLKFYPGTHSPMGTKFDDIEAGDVMVLAKYTGEGSDWDKPTYGTHIGVVVGKKVELDDKTGITKYLLDTCEGNALVYGPDGKKREGVGTATRGIYKTSGKKGLVCRIYKPSVWDFFSCLYE